MVNVTAPIKDDNDGAEAPYILEDSLPTCDLLITRFKNTTTAFNYSKRCPRPKQLIPRNTTVNHSIYNYD